MAVNEECDMLKLKHKRKKEKIKDLKIMRNNLQLTMVFFKWKTAAVTLRNIEAASSHNFSSES